MSRSVEGKIAVVSGGSTGVGKAVAKQLTESGAQVVVLARRPDRLKAAVAEIGGDTLGIPTDIGDGESVRAAFGTVAERFGKVDILFNCAGAARIRAIEDSTDEDIKACVGTNLLGPIHTTRSAVPLLRAAGGGDLVNVSSEITLDHMPLMSLYSATKHGLNGFTNAMRKDLRPDGIRVTLVILGAVGDTAFFENNFTREDRERARPVWDADGYLARVGATKAITSADVSQILFELVTRPAEIGQDVMHIRPAG